MSHVRISLGGLLLVDLRKMNVCQLDVIPCRDHVHKIDIQKIVTNMGTPQSAVRIETDLEKAHNIEIKSSTKTASDFRRHQTDLQFNRRVDPGDNSTTREDYRWLLRLGDPSLDAQKLTEKLPPDGASEWQIRQKLLIHTGTLHTELITREQYASYKVNKPEIRSLIGWVAYRMQVRVELSDNESLLLLADGDEKHRLQHEDNIDYHITIDNNCAPLATEPDFEYYFRAVTTDKGEPFGLDGLVTADIGFPVGNGLVYGSRGIPCTLLAVTEDGDIW